MANNVQNGKRSLINKANQTMVITVAVSGFLIVFSLVASRALLSQRSYQSRVIEKKETAVNQLKSNVQAVDKLAVSYKSFVDTQDNVLGGSPSGTGAKDGNNAKIVLDALPSKYDFPAFVTSVEALLRNQGINVLSIGGTDDEVAQTTSSKPGQPVEIPFQVESQVGGYADVQRYFQTLERSIRPIRLNTVEITGAGQQITIKSEATSYYQSEKGLTIKMETVK